MTWCAYNGGEEHEETQKESKKEEDGESELFLMSSQPLYLREVSNLAFYAQSTITVDKDRRKQRMKKMNIYTERERERENYS